MIKKIISLLEKKDINNGLITLFVIALQALVEVSGAAAIFPLLILIIDRDKTSSNFFINQLSIVMDKFGIISENNKNFGLIAILFFLTFLILLVRVYSSYRRINFLESVRFSLGKRLLNSYLSQSYEFFINNNSNDLAKNILSEVDQIVGKVLYPLVNMTAQLIVGFGLLLFLFVINPKIGFLFITIGSLIYLIFLNKIGKTLLRIGNARLYSQKKRFISINEILSGIKTIKVSNTEKYSIRKFLIPNRIFSRMNSFRIVLNETPSFFVETFAILGLILVSIINEIKNNSSNPDSLALIALYGYTFFKIKPSITALLSGTSGLKYGEKTINKIFEDLKLEKKKTHKKYPYENKIEFRKDLILKDISYKYFKSGQKSLSNINLNIKKGQSVAIVGRTGCGKTTLSNIILGLFKPTSGDIFIDGEKLNNTNLLSWQNNIGYVAQDVFMLDASISENISFGRNANGDNKKAIRIAAKKAGINGFIENDLKEGYATKIGDKGIRLSGGEKQRIALARALYKDPNVLILDEATSALDPITEKKVIEEMQDLAKEKTLIMIAHRISTIKNCDLIIVLNKGVLETFGSFEELQKRNKYFSQMVDP